MEVCLRNIDGGKITSICAFFFIHNALFTFSKMSKYYLRTLANN